MPKRLALLVGINDYGDDSGLSPLNFAEADVDLLSAVLIGKGGFDTTVLKGRDATQPKRVSVPHTPGFACGDFAFDFNLSGP